MIKFQIRSRQCEHNSLSALVVDDGVLELFDGGLDIATGVGLVARCGKPLSYLVANLARLVVLAIDRERLSGVIVSTCSSRLGEAARLQRFVALTKEFTHFSSSR